MHSGGGNSGPTLQQQQLQTAQALTTANLNLEENAQRKAVLNEMQGTRVFRGSALSRALRGNTPGADAGGAPSATQNSVGGAAITPPQASLVDTRDASASGATDAGGTGASADATTLASVRGASTAYSRGRMAP